jgi:hypothetical protein
MTGARLRSFARRVAVTGCAIGMAFAALGTAQASASVLGAKPTINTYKSWDGSEDVVPFGCPDTTTYGQVITVPSGYSKLNKFTFSWVNLGTGSMKARGEVYAWDGSKATGSALYQSAARFVSFSDGLYHFETFKPGGVPVTAGQQYVIFASIDKEYEKCKNNYEVGWAYTGADVYAGGGFVYQNNAGDESQWTTSAWNTFGGADIAFKAYLG